MKKIIRLTESDLTRLIKRVIIESKKSKEIDYDKIKDILGDKGIYPNSLWYTEFEDSEDYHKIKKFKEKEDFSTIYANALYDFIFTTKPEGEEEDEEED